ncbi:MAG: hypothetical protein ACQR33_00515 [Candidatus Saccharibacteria bacterium]
MDTFDQLKQDGRTVVKTIITFIAVLFGGAGTAILLGIFVGWQAALATIGVTILLLGYLLVKSIRTQLHAGKVAYEAVTKDNPFDDPFFTEPFDHSGLLGTRRTSPNPSKTPASPVVDVEETVTGVDQAASEKSQHIARQLGLTEDNPTTRLGTNHGES